jgi:hypothetical protein
MLGYGNQRRHLARRQAWDSSSPDRSNAPPPNRYTTPPFAARGLAVIFLTRSAVDRLAMAINWLAEQRSSVAHRTLHDHLLANWTALGGYDALVLGFKTGNHGHVAPPCPFDLSDPRRTNRIMLRALTGETPYPFFSPNYPKSRAIRCPGARCFRYGDLWRHGLQDLSTVLVQSCRFVVVADRERRSVLSYPD